MLWPKKKFIQGKKIPAARKSPPPPPVTFLMVRPLLKVVSIPYPTIGTPLEKPGYWMSYQFHHRVSVRNCVFF